MEIGIDFVDFLDLDVASKILALLNDPADIIRASAVSRSWHNFVIANGFSKQLWLRKVPQFSNIICAAEETHGIIKLWDVSSRDPVSRATLEKEHKIYSSLLYPLLMPIISPKNCIAFPIGASSTDHPSENIIHTLTPTDRYPRGASYWSSKGHPDPNAPENILYRLNTNICIVTEIDIRPFAAFLQPGKPVYSAKSVRFRMGHPKSIEDTVLVIRPVEQPSVDKYVWTYTSPQFPMRQESVLQQFKLPEPVVCVGGVLLIELLGRAQMEESDGLFYICLSYVRMLGHPLEPAYELAMSQTGELQLKYYPHALDSVVRSICGEVRHANEEDDEILLQVLWPMDLLGWNDENGFVV